MNKKVLILYDSLDFFIPFMESKEIEVARLYKKRNYLISIIKKFFLKLDLFAPFWYEDWHKKINSYNQVIIFATKDYSFIRKIKKTNPNIKILFWYWNPASRMGLPKKELYSLSTIWSFDKDDCEKFDLNYNTTFYFEKIELGKKEIKHDTLFVGINKGRRAILEELNENLDRIGLKNYFYIVPDKDEVNLKNVKPIPYKEYLNLLAMSKCIIDILPVGQSGQTLRPMESIFFKKKLITNDQYVIYEDFYDRNNIFILGIDKIENCLDFINSPYKEIRPDIVKKYDFIKWLERFNVDE